MKEKNIEKNIMKELSFKELIIYIIKNELVVIISILLVNLFYRDKGANIFTFVLGTITILSVLVPELIQKWKEEKKEK